MATDDHWSRVDYRRLIAWPERIRREWPFLERMLPSTPGGLIVDLGSGTGEHSRALADHGFTVVGVDSSQAMLTKAAEEPLPSNLRFVEGDITDVHALVPGPASGAISLGNTLPHLDVGAMRRLAAGLAATLSPGAPFIFQILNYERIRARKIRHLPLNFREGDEGTETIFLRLIETYDDGSVIFTPTTLRYVPGGDPPLEIMSTRSVRLHGWTWPELRAVFGEVGFSTARVFGGYDGAPFDAAESSDVIGVITR